MIGTIVFVAVFVVLGLAVVFAAMRGGGPARHTPSSGRGGGLATTGLVVLMLVVALGIPLLVVIANSDNHDKKGPGGVQLTSAEANGRLLFAKNCATCHTLKGSNAVGKVGPNLDTLNGGNVPKALVLNAIQQGRAAGNGNMPAGLLTGDDAQDVATYVARVAGR